MRRRRRRRAARAAAAAGRTQKSCRPLTRQRPQPTSPPPACCHRTSGTRHRRRMVQARARALDSAWVRRAGPHFACPVRSDPEARYSDGVATPRDTEAHAGHGDADTSREPAGDDDMAPGESRARSAWRALPGPRESGCDRPRAPPVRCQRRPCATSARRSGCWRRSYRASSPRIKTWCARCRRLRVHSVRGAGARQR